MLAVIEKLCADDVSGHLSFTLAEYLMMSWKKKVEWLSISKQDAVATKYSSIGF